MLPEYFVEVVFQLHNGIWNALKCSSHFTATQETALSIHLQHPPAPGKRKEEESMDAEKSPISGAWQGLRSALTSHKQEKCAGGH